MIKSSHSRRPELRKPAKQNLRHTDGLCDVLFTREHNKMTGLECGDYKKPAQQYRKVRIFEDTQKIDINKNNSPQEISNQSKRTLIPKLSRFGFGIEEKCSSGLYLSHKPKITQSLNQSTDPYELIESGVAIWEQKNLRSRRYKIDCKLKNLRRYGLTTAAHFLYAFGPWSIQSGDKISIHGRRSSSAVSIRRSIMDPDLQLPVSKKQLTASVSMTSIKSGISTLGSTRGRVVLFWTPDYWYRPRAATAAYHELRRHLNQLRDFQLDKTQVSQRKFFLKKNHSYQYDDKKKLYDKTSCILSRIFSSKQGKKKKKYRRDDSRLTNHFQSILKMNLRITVWDLDSATVARQLTLIDRDLFLRIPLTEMHCLINQKSSRNTPNISAWIAFSHRISCLTASEILAIQKLDMRTRIVVRFINVANKCYSMGNFHSCRSILAGLQSPSIYRLKSTWSYVKAHHNTRYQIMSKLCKVFKNPRTKAYTNAWMKAERAPPLIPYVGDLLIKVLEIDRETGSHCNQADYQQPAERQVIPVNWDSGSTFLTHDFNGRISAANFNNQQAQVYRENKQGILQKILSVAMVKFRHGASNSQIKTLSKDIFWAARQLILARKYFNRWKMVVITAKIISEKEKKKQLSTSERKSTEIITSWLINCQRHAQGYEFPGHSLAWEFLLKARYQEDKENFILSRKLEPPV